MKIWNIKTAIAATIYILCTNACVEEIHIRETDSEIISFTVALPPMSKSAPIYTSVSENLSQTITEWGFEADASATKAAPTLQLSGHAGVTVYQYDGDWQGDESSWEELTNADFVFDGSVLVGQSARWSTVNSDRLRIYAYAPYVTDSSDEAVVGNLTIPYTVNQDIQKQTDLISAHADVVVADSKGRSIPLAFNHILTAVRFRAGFDCTVNSVTISGIYGSGEYSTENGWETSDSEATSSYTVNFSPGKEVTTTDMITGYDQTFMLIPQTLSAGAVVSMTYTKDGGQKTISAKIEGREWEEGKMITYTLYEVGAENPYKYFDLAAGDISIGYEVKKTGDIVSSASLTYTGYVYVNGEKTLVSGKHDNSNIYYVYQSTADVEGEYDKNHTGWQTAINTGECIIPDYKPVMNGGWADYITDNSVVEDVIHAWDSKDGATGAVRKVGRTVTNNRIHVSGPIKCNLTIDDIYSNYQINSQGRRSGSLAFNPSGSAARLTINMVGDNRVGCVHYANGSNGTKLIFEGVGSLTAADADFNTKTWNSATYYGVANVGETDYVSNHWNAAIGNSDSGDTSVGIEINSGTIYAGTTKAENCSAIGGGGNGKGEVTINGGNVTAVAATTGTAIGGGIGFKSSGGVGAVTITGGNVYAYNHGNRWDIPSAAIGGAGSSADVGNTGTVTISGGNIYAQTALGTAIGGGSSQSKNGGSAIITISGGNVIAKSLRAESEVNPGTWIEAGAGIGGGSGCTGGKQSNTNINVNGGNATIRISGNSVIKTGSIGGGKSGHSDRGNIGTADIEVTGGDIQAQFVMAGSTIGNAAGFTSPKFTMTGGIIRNSDTKDNEFHHIAENGGAVHMEDGTFTMKGGVISECHADYGGAIYIKKGAQSDTPPSFMMSGGSIYKCSAAYDGGGVYIEDGTAEVSGDSAIEYCNAGSADILEGRGGAVCIRKTGAYSPSFTMSGGTLANNTAIYNGGALHLEGGTVIISGGQVSRNIVSNGDGGGVSINSGSFSMPAGGSAVINANSAQCRDGSSTGGGVYVTSLSDQVVVELLSGSIVGNSSSTQGGGIGVDVSESGVEALVTVGNKNDSEARYPDISGNITVSQGGGLYVNGSEASIIINSGRILQNSTVGYVDNPDVVNVAGKVTLNGGDVKSNDIIFDGNGGNLTGEPQILQVSQRIVTDTNNILSVPEFFRNGYRFVRWNTRPDGLGTDYIDGQTIKRSTDLTLYAIWEID